MINQNKQGSNRILTLLLVMLFSVISFTGGYFVSTLEKSDKDVETTFQKEIVNKSVKRELPEDIDFSLFWDVWESVEKQHIDQPVDESKMFYGALAGVVASLQDPYSVFLDPELTTSFNQSVLDGTFEGIGAEIGIQDNRIVIISPLPGTPADLAGLKPGDIILAIDNIDTSNMSLDYAVQIIRGEKATQVNFIVEREDGRNEEVAVIRDTIKVESVKWETKEVQNKKIAYIQITSFNNDTSAKFNEAIAEILLEQPQGLVLDLRNNAGGLLDQSVQVSSRFIPAGPIVHEKFVDGSSVEYKALGNARLEGIKTVVLINEGSASAAEIVAGALKDYKVAALVGEKTFGKGSVQTLEDFSDGSSLKLTIANWLTPNGDLIDKVGVEPDIVVEMTNEDYDAERDPQLDKAMEMLL